MTEQTYYDCDNCPHRQDERWADYAAHCHGRRVSLDRAAFGALTCGSASGPDASQPSLSLEQWDRLHYLTLGHIADLYERGELPR